ncbi:flavin reductase family protein [Pseudomonas fluorescens]|uniref:flavin reductase family protein n=1 Tax=Pseudomonas fluorescens TaxID=294 RepID=UPI001C0E9ACE|nr:flavin reductase family protein [Pseudomonas fluorescens]
MMGKGVAPRRRSLEARKEPDNHLEEIETQATVDRAGADGNRLQPKQLSGSATLLPIAAQGFAINVLAHEQQLLSDRFATPTADKFSQVPYAINQNHNVWVWFR